jgi:hypothetical protein
VVVVLVRWINLPAPHFVLLAPVRVLLPMPHPLAVPEAFSGIAMQGIASFRCRPALAVRRADQRLDGALDTIGKIMRIDLFSRIPPQEQQKVVFFLRRAELQGRAGFKHAPVAADHRGSFRAKPLGHGRKLFAKQMSRRRIPEHPGGVGFLFIVSHG